GGGESRRRGRDVGVRLPAAEPAALAKARIAAAAVVLIAAAVLRYYEVPPVPTWFYVFAWYPTLVILDQAVVLAGGDSLLARPRELAGMLWWSAVIWFLFEAINFRLRNWYYVFLPANLIERWAGITVSLATVVPAVLLPERLLDRLGVWHRLESRPVALRPHDLRFAFPLGCVGFTFFALEVWSLYHLLLRRTEPRTLAPSLLFAVLVLAGMDRLTVSSTTPLLADLPGVTNDVGSRLQRAGYTDLFRLARAPVAELAYRAGISPDEARAAREAARLSTLRGIGTRHAAALIASGIGTVEALAQADPERVSRIAHGSAHPTLPEVRVWVRAAETAAGAGQGRPETQGPGAGTSPEVTR